MASQSIIWNLIQQSPFWLAHRLVPEFLMGGRPRGVQRPRLLTAARRDPATGWWHPTFVNFLGQN